jgi:hypothetical protein
MKVKPKTMAYDAVRDQAVLLASHGKDRYLLLLSSTMDLKIARKFSAKSDDICWTADAQDGSPGIMLWNGDTTVFVPLYGDGKGKVLKVALNWRAKFSTRAPGLFGVTKDDRLCRFDGAAWQELGDDAPEGWAICGSLAGAKQCSFRSRQWTDVVAQSPTSVSTTLAVTSTGTHWLVAASSGTFIGDVGGPAAKIDAGWGWCAIGMADRFFVSRSHRVWQVGLDGSQTDTGVAGDDPPDHALFRCGERAFYLTGTSVVHRYQDGVWTPHDLAPAAAAIGLG